MRFVDRKEFWGSVRDLEEVFLIAKNSSGFMLISDMEYSENIIKIEKMAFMLPDSLRMEEAVTECRSFYCGGIMIDEVEGLSAEEIISLFESEFENGRYAFMRRDAVCRDELEQDIPDGMYYIKLC